MQLITTRSGLRTQARGLVEEGEVGGALGAQLGQARLQLPQLRGQSGSRMIRRLVSLGGRGPLGEELAHGREPRLAAPAASHGRMPTSGFRPAGVRAATGGANGSVGGRGAPLGAANWARAGARPVCQTAGKRQP